MRDLSVRRVADPVALQRLDVERLDGAPLLRRGGPGERRPDTEGERHHE